MAGIFRSTGTAVSRSRGITNSAILARVTGTVLDRVYNNTQNENF